MTGIGKTPRDPTPDLTGRAGYPITVAEYRGQLP